MTKLSESTSGRVLGEHGAHRGGERFGGARVEDAVRVDARQVHLVVDEGGARGHGVQGLHVEGRLARGGEHPGVVLVERGGLRAVRGLMPYDLEAGRGEPERVTEVPQVGGEMRGPDDAERGDGRPGPVVAAVVERLRPVQPP
ncbi:hypothetical protein GA0115246_104411 [Streptomyces sp. SolWspMP-sol7th]|nr:hypothetical protein GA0115246_104411 [Streptomyces sp. SolWspMP-sol7th]